MRNPTKAPAPRPQSTARGKLVAGAPSPTPAMNLMDCSALRCRGKTDVTYSTASMPSRSTVTKGRMNMAYFSDHRFNLPLIGSFESFCSSTLEIFTRHLS